MFLSCYYVVVCSVCHHVLFRYHIVFQLVFFQLLYLIRPFHQRPAARVIPRGLLSSRLRCVPEEVPREATHRLHLGRIRPRQCSHAPMLPPRAAKTFPVTCPDPCAAPGGPYRSLGSSDVFLIVDLMEFFSLLVLAETWFCKRGLDLVYAQTR